MVDLVVLQSVSYIAGATGVAIAAIFYVLNLRISQRNMKQTLETRRIGLIDSITTRIANAEGRKNYQELMNYEWTDYDDFERRYGTDYNLDSSSKRYATWFAYNAMGVMIRKGMVEAEDIYDMGMFPGALLWEKYRFVIDEVRRRYFGRDYLVDLEYLAREMLRVKLQRDPQYKIPESFIKYVPDK